MSPAAAGRGGGTAFKKIAQWTQRMNEKNARIRPWERLCCPGRSEGGCQVDPKTAPRCSDIAKKKKKLKGGFPTPKNFVW